MRKPIISICITNFNYSKYIEKSIVSALDQSFNKKDYEIIIIDDGSSDNSRNIIKKYLNNQNIRTVFNKKNKGLVKSINIGIKASKGEYFLRLDADDKLNRNALTNLYNVINKDNEIGIVYSDFYIIDEFDHIIKREKKINLNESKINIMDTAPHGACSLIRKNFLIENGMYDENFDRQDGYDLWYKFFKKYKIRNVNKPLFFYRKHQKSLSSNLFKLLETRSHIIRKVIKSKRKIKNYCLIPVRGKQFDKSCISNEILKKKTVLEWTIDTVLKTNNIDKIILTSGDLNLLNRTKKKYKKKIIYHLRDEKYCYENTSYMNLIPKVIENKKIQDPDNIVILNIESPFRKSFYIDNAINNHIFNKADKTISVSADTSGHFYKYGKNGLKLISNKSYEKFRTEKKYIFSENGGIEVINFEKLKKKTKLDKVSHILLDKISSFTIKDEFDLKVAKKIDF